MRVDATPVGNGGFRLFGVSPGANPGANPATPTANSIPTSRPVKHDQAQFNTGTLATNHRATQANLRVGLKIRSGGFLPITVPLSAGNFRTPTPLRSITVLGARRVQPTTWEGHSQVMQSLQTFPVSRSNVDFDIKRDRTWIHYERSKSVFVRDVSIKSLGYRSSWINDSRKVPPKPIGYCGQVLRANHLHRSTSR